jgi:hypothetical protein
MRGQGCDQHVWTVVTWRGDDGNVMMRERICFRCARRGSLPAKQDVAVDGI